MMRDAKAFGYEIIVLKPFLISHNQGSNITETEVQIRNTHIKKGDNKYNQKHRVRHPQKKIK